PLSHPPSLPTRRSSDLTHTGASWMGAISGGTSIAGLSIPGTHDTGARFEPTPGTTKCQDLTVADQLSAGIRYFDIRCRNVANKLDRKSTRLNSSHVKIS